jgi:phosphatidylethanolamine/phosphatidyl-N-methylethanolamine N-methyltransferase
MDLGSIRRTYRRYANHYDWLFGPVLEPGRRRAVQLASAPGRRILEVGVGTGLALPHYRADCRVVGIDLSPEMLEIARRRSANLANVEALHLMDAESLEFPDGSFDAVVAMYVASVVPRPDRLMAEMHRVCAPGGEIIVVNHFESTNPLIHAIETALAPLSRVIGFHPDFALEQLPCPEGLRRERVHDVNLLGLWKVIHFRDTRPAPQRSRPHEPGVAAPRPSREAVASP